VALIKFVCDFFVAVYGRRLLYLLSACNLVYILFVLLCVQKGEVVKEKVARVSRRLNLDQFALIITILHQAIMAVLSLGYH